MRIILLVLVVLSQAACNPSDRRPGLWLTGTQTKFAGDWTFTDDYREIAVQVSTPYLVPHSVTIWSGSLDGTLYIGASAPETKRWPGWVDANPQVTLKIGELLYQVQLKPLEEESLIGEVQGAFASKYELPERSPQYEGQTSRYWRVQSM